MAAVPFRVKATFDYNSPHEDDLSFSLGQVITVTDEEDEDWYYGEFTDADGEAKRGLFPKNFVERYEPTTPPRPSRSTRPKREPEVEPEHEPAEASLEAPERLGPGLEEAPMEDALVALSENTTEPTNKAASNDMPDEAPIPATARSRRSWESPAKLNENVQPTPAVPAQTSKQPPPQQSASKAPPPTVASKPTSSSFRDRIAAFNKPAATPPPPVKSGQPSVSSFVKKPFVPPPPSRDAYVRPPPEVPLAKVYKAQEDVHGVPAKEDIRVGGPPSEVGDADDQPKPTSLKERIALLQKQQLEQAARHAEAAQKKEKPRKPPKKKSDPPVDTTVAGESTLSEAFTAVTTAPESEQDAAFPRASRHRTKSKEGGTPLGSPAPTPQDSISDPNDADQSAGGDTEDSEVLIRNKKPQTISVSGIPPLPPGRQPAPAGKVSYESEESDAADEDRREAASEAEVEDEEQEGEEEDDIDPEVKRRMEIRDRMAKMSGGMGMAGMFGGPGLPPIGAKKAKQNSGASNKRSLEGEAMASASPPQQPVPIMALPGMTMPGLSKVRSPEPIENPMDDAAETGHTREDSDAEESEGIIAEKEDELAEERLKDKLRSPPPPPRGSLSGFLIVKWEFEIG